MPGGPELRWPGKRPPTPSGRPARLELSVAGPPELAPDALYRGDNLELLADLRGRERVDLIYLDPPFNSRADYNRAIRLRGAGDHKSTHLQYEDDLNDEDYLQFMYERLILCHELLADHGALFLHCDWHQSHRLRLILDEIFGPERFQNELIWHYYNKFQGNVGRFAANHDTIFYYTKSNQFTFNRIRERRAAPVKQIKRIWSSEKRAIVNAKGPDGKIEYVTATHKTIDDVWRVSMLQPADRREAVGYPTQKPEALLERILAAATNPGDLVVDPFMGSGTTAAVARKLGRRFIGGDLGRAAVHTCARRLLRLREGGELGIKNGLDQPAPSPSSRIDAGVEVHAFDDAAPAGTAGIELVLADRRLEVASFRAPSLLRTLGLTAAPDDWRALVDAIFIDFDHDGATLRPSVCDLPGGREPVCGSYEVPARVGVVAVQIVDVLGDAWMGLLHSNR